MGMETVAILVLQDSNATTYLVFFVPFAVRETSRLNLHIDLEKFSEVLAEAARFVGDSNVAKKKRECICYQVFLTNPKFEELSVLQSSGMGYRDAGILRKRCKP